MPRKKTAVIALGGNSLLRKGEWGSIEEQRARINETAKVIAELVKKKWRVVVVHGNGPQIGNLLLQQEFSKAVVPDMPLDVLVAETQGQIGYELQQALENYLHRKRVNKGVLTIITQVRVSESDPAFKKPSKPVGPYYSEKEAKSLREKMNLKKTSKGWRRVVASPKPLEVIEWRSLKKLVNEGFLLITCGGGGVPVIRKNDNLEGVEAVIDKDLSAGRLAEDLKADLLVFLTDVDYAYLNYDVKGKTPVAIRKTDLYHFALYSSEGHFKEGSMKPKAQSIIDFVAVKGKKAVITTPEGLHDALEGRTGTIVTK